MFSDSAFFLAYKRQWGISACKGCTAEFMSCTSSLFLTQQHKLKQLSVAAGEAVRRKVSILRLLLILYNIIVLRYLRHRAVTTSIGRASGALCDTARGAGSCSGAGGCRKVEGARGQCLH